MPAYYLTTDLFFSSRVCGVARRIGVDLQTMPSVATLLEHSGEAPLVLVDLHLPQLDLPAAVRAIKERWSTTRIVAYAPHVQEELLAAAQAAGCDEVLSRGQFDRDMERVLRG